jgi:hypothetical protein
MAAILDTGRRWRTQFWKGTIQGSFQQSLVEIGSVVSEEKIFFELFNMYYRIFYELWTFAYFDRLCKLEKRGDEIKKKSSPLKLLSQFQQFGWDWLSSFRGEDFFNFTPPFF